MTSKTEVAYLELITFEWMLENVLDCSDNRVGKNIPLMGTMNNYKQVGWVQRYKTYYKVNVYRNQTKDILNVIFTQQNNDNFILQTVRRLGMAEKPESSIPFNGTIWRMGW